MTDTNADDVYTRVRRIAAVFADKTIDSITAETTVIEGLGLDSLDLLQVMLALEEEFKIELSDDEIMRLETVGAVASHITKRIAV